MSEEKKSCKEQANEVLLRALKTHAFACEHEHLNKKRRGGYGNPGGGDHVP